MAQTSKQGGGETGRASFRFSPRTSKLLDIMSKQDALNKTAWIETTITRLARERGIDVDKILEETAE